MKIVQVSIIKNKYWGLSYGWSSSVKTGKCIRIVWKKYTWNEKDVGETVFSTSALSRDNESKLKIGAIISKKISTV